jgi:hypothetical protein
LGVRQVSGIIGLPLKHGRLVTAGCRIFLQLGQELEVTPFRCLSDYRR